MAFGAALRAGEGDLVHVGAVQLEAGEVAAGQLAQLGAGADRRCRGRSAQRQTGSGVPQ